MQPVVKVAKMSTLRSSTNITKQLKNKLSNQQDLQHIELIIILLPIYMSNVINKTTIFDSKKTRLRYVSYIYD